MCLAIPGKILSITNQLDETFRFGKVSFGGINKEVNLCMVPEANIGDYVLVHVGVAMSVVDEEEAQKVFSYLKDMGEVEELNNDRMSE
jgi:hydrogenase expression/formation protein HypC